MGNDQIQLIALVLEVVGLWLAFCHIFLPKFGKKLDRAIHYSMTALGARNMDYAFPGVDYDDSIKDEDKGAAAIGYISVMMFSYTAMWLLWDVFEFGEGFWWGIPEVLLVVLSGAIAGPLAHILFSFGLNFLDFLIHSLGGATMLQVLV
ncbi:hypothetical protein [Pseudomonas sp.]|uniref:hypothetical protein n=1 Tax=Pseudomonas sp. TaxID=306 RepID=UPI00257FC1AA|nr:hypothetical protein [Pseudomonas sp.]